MSRAAVPLEKPAEVYSTVRWEKPGPQGPPVRKADRSTIHRRGRLSPTPRAPEGESSESGNSGLPGSPAQGGIPAG